METNINPMTPEQIKSALKQKGVRPAAIAREIGKTGTAVRQVINGTSVSHGIRLHIAACLNLPVESVFYIKPNPTRKGRPLAHGLFDIQAA